MILAIHLTEEQRQAIESQQGQPLEIIDPATNRVYFLVGAEHPRRVRALLEQSVSNPTAEPGARIAPLMLRSMQAYWHALPSLLKLKSKECQWVAYHGEEQVGLGKTQTALYQECFRRGLQRGEFYVGRLQADPEGIPPWGTHAADWSLYEVSEPGGEALSPPLE